MFALHPQLEKDSLPLVRLKLCEVRLMNNSHFPWLLLVPMHENLREITDLSDANQHLLMDEISLCSSLLQAKTQAHKMNIGALGNMVPQLHVHVIARFSDDAAWPNPVWGGASAAYAPDAAKALSEELLGLFHPVG